MKRKIICISMIGLLLLTGVASFSVASEPMKQKTPVVKSENGQYDIKIFGKTGVNILILPLKNLEYTYTIKIDGDEKIGPNNPLVPFTHISVKTLRLTRVITSLEVLLEVTVVIPDTLQTETRTGKIFGPFVIWDK